MKYLKTGGAFCIAACFGFCSTKHLRAFSPSLHSKRIKKAKPEMILPPVPADTHGPRGCGTAALNKAHHSSRTAGADPSKEPVCPGQSWGKTCPSSWKLPGAEAAVIIIPIQQFQPSYSGAFLPALPTSARFSQHTDTSLHLLQKGPPPLFSGTVPQTRPSPHISSLPR